MPHWVFNAGTVTDLRGERGDDHRSGDTTGLVLPVVVLLLVLLLR